MKTIWSDQGQIPATRGPYLTQADIKGIIELHPTAFVVAAIGRRLEWISHDKCYSFWKLEVKQHIADPSTNIYLEYYRGEYAYLASQWLEPDSTNFILLEKIH
ncbi:hypothetical protein P1X16_19405 [Hymenobacter sp. YC55]|nr:hypothetical protein [Hymenobacter sp. YC55]